MLFGFVIMIDSSIFYLGVGKGKISLIFSLILFQFNTRTRKPRIVNSMLDLPDEGAEKVIEIVIKFIVRKPYAVVKNIEIIVCLHPQETTPLPPTSPGSSTEEPGSTTEELVSTTTEERKLCFLEFQMKHTRCACFQVVTQTANLYC